MGTSGPVNNMASASAAPPIGHFTPDRKHTDKERWICIYPCYINSKKTVAEGRRIPQQKAVDNPTAAEMRDVLAGAGFVIGVENKVHPREVECRDTRLRGRIRLHFRNDDGS